MNNKRKIVSSVEEDFEDVFIIYPWDNNQVTGTSDEDLGLSYVIECYGDEFINVDDETLNEIKETLLMYFDDDAFVRDWNINYPNDQIESIYDIEEPEDLDLEELARYFDYEAYGRDIRLENRMIWNTAHEFWFSALGQKGDDLISKYEDEMIFLGESRKPVVSAREEISEDGVRELVLMSDNTSEIYETLFMPIFKNLRRKAEKGIYDSEKAVIAWLKVIDECARIYNRKFGNGENSLILFNRATRMEAAKRLEEKMREDIFADLDSTPIFDSLDNKPDEEDDFTFREWKPGEREKLKKEVETELDKQLEKVHARFTPDVYEETVDYILTMFIENNAYTPSNVKQAVHEWYLETKNYFPDMFESKPSKIMNSRYLGWLKSKRI